MGIAVIPAPSSGGGKIMKKLTLTSGSSWTVPAGVTDINVTLVGGGGGGGGASLYSAEGNSSAGGNGGTTTFTGATSASGGNGGSNQSFNSGTNGTGGLSTAFMGATPAANSGLGGSGVWTSRDGNAGRNGISQKGADGQIIISTLSVTPGSSIGYSIGSGGNAGNSYSAAAPSAGASGRIDIEYWV